MADGANEATEVVKFTQELEFNNLMATSSYFDVLKTQIFGVESNHGIPSSILASFRPEAVEDRMSFM